MIIELFILLCLKKIKKFYLSYNKSLSILKGFLCYLIRLKGYEWVLISK